MDLRLAVIAIPVTEVDASKTFYTQQVGFVLDHDVEPSPGMRVVQMTRRARRARWSSVPACRWGSRARSGACNWWWTMSRQSEHN